MPRSWAPNKVLGGGKGDGEGEGEEAGLGEIKRGDSEETEKEKADVVNLTSRRFFFLCDFLTVLFVSASWGSAWGV